MNRDGVDRAGGAHHLGRDHLGAGAVLGLGGQHEARVAGVVDVALVVVVVDPGRQPAAQAADERQRGLLERRAAPLAGEGDVEHRDAARQRVGRRQRAGRQDRRSAAAMRGSATAQT